MWLNLCLYKPKLIIVAEETASFDKTIELRTLKYAFIQYII